MEKTPKYSYDYSKLLGLMREKGVTQTDLANYLGIAVSTLNQKLKGYVIFSQIEIEKICEYLEVQEECVKVLFFTHKLGIS